MKSTRKSLTTLNSQKDNDGGNANIVETPHSIKEKLNMTDDNFSPRKEIGQKKDIAIAIREVDEEQAGTKLLLPINQINKKRTPK